MKHRTQRFYKYRSLDGKGRKYTEDILFKGIFFFSNIDSFNDPFEFEYKLSFCATKKTKKNWLKHKEPELYSSVKDYSKKELIKYIESIEKKKESWKKNVRKEVIKKTSAFCLSSDWKEISLWTHYANAHKGICIEFKNLRETDLGDCISKVNYIEDIPTVNVYTGKMSHTIATTKHKTFDKEQEYRIIGTKQTKVTFSPVSKVISKIYLGIRFDIHDPIIDLIKMNLPEVEIVKLKKSADKYSVEVDYSLLAKDFNVI